MLSGGSPHKAYVSCLQVDLPSLTDFVVDGAMDSKGKKLFLSYECLEHLRGTKMQVKTTITCLVPLLVGIGVVWQAWGHADKLDIHPVNHGWPTLSSVPSNSVFRGVPDEQPCGFQLEVCYSSKRVWMHRPTG